MALVDMKDLLNHAYRNSYAVGAFEIVSLDFLKAVMKAAEDSRSPVILNVNDRKGKIKNLDLLMAGVERAASISSVPVAINFDHCSASDDIVNGIRLGCNSVMFDASDTSFPENVSRTAKAVDLAHSCGLPVEGSLGHVSCVNEEEKSDTPSEPVLTSIYEVSVYIERTGVDFLAISIGTMHGRVLNKHKLDFGRLVKINEAAKIPLVIHGGTGLTDSQYNKLIDNGVAKINYFTALSEQVMETIRSSIQDAQSDYLTLFEQVRESIYTEVKRCMQLWRSAGRAAEVLIQCSAWHKVAHIIVHKSEAADALQTQQMVLQGKHELSRIPGVMNVNVGKSVMQNGISEYCWLICLANKSVVETFKKDPIYLSYANNYLSSQGKENSSVDYEMLNEAELEPVLMIATHA